HVPDVLVELQHRHPDWDLTRTLDFPARQALALEAASRMDALVFTRPFNSPPGQPDYLGPLREPDRTKPLQGEDIPYGDWALSRLPAEHPGQWEAPRVCETGPFWAVIFARKPAAPQGARSKTQARSALASE